VSIFVIKGLFLDTKQGGKSHTISQAIPKTGVFTEVQQAMAMWH